MIDRAFESRIDIALNYANLDAGARAQVLQNLLHTLPAHSIDISQRDIEGLMQKPLNGRHIKSAVKTGLILAESEGAKLSKRHLDLVLDLRERSVKLD